MCPRIGYHLGFSVADKHIHVHIHNPDIAVPKIGVRMWHDDLKALVSGRTLLSRAAVDWALRRVALESALISACARTLGCSWNALDRAVRAHGMRILSRSDLYARVTRIGVDEHVWRHGAFGDRYVTVIVDLTPRADGSVRPDASAPRSSCHIRAQATHS